MTRRRDIEKHRRCLDEIHDIMNAMKNLSYMETRKISGFLYVQHSVVKHIWKSWKLLIGTINELMLAKILI